MRSTRPDPLPDSTPPDPSSPEPSSPDSFPADSTFRSSVCGTVPRTAGPTGARLDRPVWHALNGPQAALGQPALDEDGTVLAVRYDPEMSPFAAVGDIEDRRGWDALATIVPAGQRTLVMVRSDAPDTVAPWPPEGWAAVADIPGLQMVAQTMTPVTDGRAAPLGPGDVPEMLDLVSRTRPGPFEKRTIEFGGYIGVRDEGRLVAMAGRRFSPDGFTEISAVCTDPARRGTGLAARLVRSVAAGIVADGDVPFLHVGAENLAAIALYGKLGMCVRRSVRFIVLERLARPSAAGGD